MTTIQLNEIKGNLLRSLQSINKALDLIEKDKNDDGQSDLPGISPIISTPPAKILQGKQIALIPGHEPGGGAEGERDWNIEVAQSMEPKLEDLGAEVYIHYHLTRAYSQRQREMRAAVKARQTNNWICIELHYDDVDIPEPSGHHFQYLGSKTIAESFRDTWQKHYPESKPRRDNGIMFNSDQNGSGFLRQAPGWAVLCEPFFHSNPEENQYFMNRPNEVADVYVEAIQLFAKRSK